MSSGSRSMKCSSKYGSTIDSTDCTLALGILESNLRGQSPITFPTGSYFHTCAIGVSQSVDAPNVQATPAVQLSYLIPNLAFLLDMCVLGRRSRGLARSITRRGGVLRRNNLTFVVVNPMQVPVWGTCLAPPEPSNMDLGQCIDWRIGFGNAWYNATHPQDEDDPVGPVGAGVEGLGAFWPGAIRTSAQGSALQQEAVSLAMAAASSGPTPFGSEIESPIAHGNTQRHPRGGNSGRNDDRGTVE